MWSLLLKLRTLSRLSVGVSLVHSTIDAAQKRNEKALKITFRAPLWLSCVKRGRGAFMGS